MSWWTKIIDLFCVKVIKHWKMLLDKHAEVHYGCILLLTPPDIQVRELTSWQSPVNICKSVKCIDCRMFHHWREISAIFHKKTSQCWRYNFRQLGSLIREIQVQGSDDNPGSFCQATSWPKFPGNYRSEWISQRATIQPRLKHICIWWPAILISIIWTWYFAPKWSSEINTIDHCDEDWQLDTCTITSMKLYFTW